MGPPPPDNHQRIVRRRERRRERERARAVRVRLLLLAAAAFAALACGVAVALNGANGSGGRQVTVRKLETERAVRAAENSAAERRGDETQAALLEAQRRLDYVARGGTRRKEIALTFDDGPARDTAKILRVLERRRAHATFFVLGTQVRENPKMLRRIARSRYAEVANHTFGHKRLDKIAAPAAANEMIAGAQEVIDAGAPIPRLVRPPYGAFNEGVTAAAHRIGELPVLWSVDSRDYTGISADQITEGVLSGVHPGAIVLMHDGGGDRTQTAAALPKIISGLRRRGYKLVTVAQMLIDNPPPARQRAAGVYDDR